MNPLIVKSKFDIKIVISLMILTTLILFSQDNQSLYKKSTIPPLIFQVGIYLFSVIIFFDILRAFFGCTIFKIEGGNLVVEKKILIISYAHHQYRIDKIKEFKLIKSGSSDIYVHFRGLRLFLSKSAVCFFYNNKEVTIDADISNNAFDNLKSCLR